MYANVETLVSLPQALVQKPASGPARRHQIGTCNLSPRGLDHFNGLLARLGRPQALDCDQVATAARSLIDTDAEAAEPVPACIAQRLRQADLLEPLLADRMWTPANGADAPLRAVLDYMRESNDLIPDWLPRIGRLDDAIVIDAAWTLVSAEVHDYRDFCRLRGIEAMLRDRDPAGFRFTRDDWEVSRRAEAELRQHQRRVRGSSYVPAATRCFRVH